ncbi:MAG: mannose-1-phosphate guanyltransferase [Bdellovibrionaceae bacterium]|nr:mannose-1-phosphate guanyltransferase [Pseudobdellovibrionaceae bacterium]
MNVMLLAAGEGTRLRPHTLIRPKPAIPFLNIPLAAYPLSLLEDMRVDRLVVNTFHLPTKIVDLFIHLNHGARRLHFSHEINQIMGSGGGLGMARDYFLNHGDLIMMNADEVILPFESGMLAKAFEFHKKNNAFCTLLTKDHPEVGTKFGGVWMNHKNEVRGFGKSAPTDDSIVAEHFIGVQILSEKVFGYIPPSTPMNILYDTVVKAMAAGALVQRYKVDCHWYETGNAQDFLQATGETLKILSGSDAQDHARIHLQQTLDKYGTEASLLETRGGATLLRSTSAIVSPKAIVNGFAVLGAKSVVPENCTIKNVTIADHVSLVEGTEAQNEIFLQDNTATFE